MAYCFMKQEVHELRNGDESNWGTVNFGETFCATLTYCSLFSIDISHHFEDWVMYI